MIMKNFGQLMTGLLLALAILIGITALEAQENSYAKGLELFFSGNYQEALDNLNKAASAAPEDPRPCFFAGICLSRMGQENKAYSMYQVASAREYLPGGRQVNVDNSLRRIQGTERQTIEKARKDVAALWTKKQKERSIKKYGDNVQKQSNAMIQSSQPISAANSKSAEAKPASNLPSVSPITPLSREEREVVESNKIYDTAVDEFQFFRDDIGKTVLSTVERKRLAEREARVTYADPMDKPSADGSKFINIYDPLEVNTDSKPFSGKDDPDDLYAEAEQSPLVTTCHFLDALSFKSKNSKGGMNSGMDSNMAGSGGDMMGGDMMGGDMMGGSDMSGSGSPAGPGRKAGSRKTGDDTNLLYNQKPASNPFNSFSGSQPESSMNPFKVDRDFKQSLETTNNSGQPGSEDGMMLSPPM